MLAIENLNVQFDTHTVVSDLTLNIAKGEIVGIVGESGSGKSMTALSVMQLLPPQAKVTGQITFEGRDGAKFELNSLPERVMQKIRGNRISMIFQDPLSAFNQSKQTGKQIAEIIEIHQKANYKTAKEQTIALLERVRLTPTNRIFDSYPFQLSGGQRQRALIAMALANSPDLLIADEPTTALDVTVQKEIVNLLVTLAKEEHLSMLFITHDLGLVSQTADFIVVMHNGIAVETGTTKDIISNPKHSYTKALLKCKPTLQQQKKRLPEVSNLLDNNNYQPNNLPSIISTSTQKQIIAVNNLEVTYSNKKQPFKAIDKVTFDLYEGETLGLVGESGCGKTTLSRTLLNLTDKTAGEIIFQGEPLQIVAANRKKFSKKIQIVFQDPYSSLNPVISVGNAICETTMVHNPTLSRKKAKMKTIDWLYKVGLNENFYKRLPSELSGGQRQRIVIARALTPQPKILICDEAVSALDVSVQARILNLLNDLKREFNLTYIFISHDLAVVKYMSDRIAIMQKGKIIELNEAEKVYNKPQNTYTRQLINSIPELKYL